MDANLETHVRVLRDELTAMADTLDSHRAASASEAAALRARLAALEADNAALRRQLVCFSATPAPVPPPRSGLEAVARALPWGRPGPRAPVSPAALGYTDAFYVHLRLVIPPIGPPAAQAVGGGSAGASDAAAAAEAKLLHVAGPCADAPEVVACAPAAGPDGRAAGPGMAFVLHVNAAAGCVALQSAASGLFLCGDANPPAERVVALNRPHLQAWEMFKLEMAPGDLAAALADHAAASSQSAGDAAATPRGAPAMARRPAVYVRTHHGSYLTARGGRLAQSAAPEAAFAIEVAPSAAFGLPEADLTVAIVSALQQAPALEAAGA